MKKPTSSEPDKSVRCAIYTRKSTEEDLPQEFNSLDAQRESAEALIVSQRHEGWEAVAESYDEHTAIVSVELFDRVLDNLKRNGPSSGTMVRNKYNALLKGLLHCQSCGCIMTHSFSCKATT